MHHMGCQRPIYFIALSHKTPGHSDKYSARYTQKASFGTLQTMKWPLLVVYDMPKGAFWVYLAEYLLCSSRYIPLTRIQNPLSHYTISVGQLALSYRILMVFEPDRPRSI